MGGVFDNTRGEAAKIAQSRSESEGKKEKSLWEKVSRLILSILQ